MLNALADSGHRVCVIYFRGEGVYNLLEPEVADSSGTPDLQCWTRFAEEHETRLLACSADSARRFPARWVSDLPRVDVAGMATWWRLALPCDRIMTF